MTTAAQSLAEAALSLADDEMILAHRDSEWTGHAPILEEDIAFSNLALDEMGHAQLWYRLAAELRDENPETYVDRLVFFRSASEYRNLRVVELPRGDWAFSTLRQYLFDALERVRLEALSGGPEPKFRAVAAKIASEERYHLRHTSAWVKRLGKGTEESHARMQAALLELMPFLPQMFTADASVGMFNASQLRGPWETSVRRHLAASGLELGPLPQGDPAGRDTHTPHLKELLEEMQTVARAEPEGTW